jgi:VanZ family protein
MFSLRFWRILTIVVTVSILVLSLLPDPPDIPGGFHFVDKIAHFIAYAVLGFLLFTSFFREKKAATVLLVAAVCLVYGGLIEILQAFTHRQPELWDLTADLLGAVCGAVLGSRLGTGIRSKLK